MVALCLQPNYSHIHSLYAIVQWKIIFQKSKIPQIHILMSFNSIRGLVTLELIIHKIICGVTGDGCLVFPAKIFLYLLSICYCWMENHFPKVKKSKNDFYLRALIALELWLVIHFWKQQSIYGVTVDGCLLFPAQLLLYSLLICCWLM